MIYFLALVLTIVTPLVGGFSTIYLVDTYLEPQRHQRLVKWISVSTELMLLATPSLILALFGFLSFTAAMWIVIGGSALFALSYYVHSGNDFESYVMTACMMILIPHVFISVSQAYETYQRRSRVEQHEPADNSATNKHEAHQGL